MRILQASLALMMFDSQQKKGGIFKTNIKNRQSTLLAHWPMLLYIRPMGLWQYSRNSFSI
jgi:hypothetical protein